MTMTFTAFRQLRRQRGLPVVVVVTLALGIGATATCFSILNAVALRPLPYHEPDGLVALAPMPVAAFDALVRDGSLFEASAASLSRGVNAATPAGAERLSAAEITGDLFAVLGVLPAAGRSLTAAELQSRARVAVVSRGVWERHYASAPSVDGQVITIDGVQRTIVGVAARSFSFPDPTDVWIPIETDGSRDAALRRVSPVARLRPGVSVAQADAALRGMSVHLGAAHGIASAQWRASARTLRSAVVAAKHGDAARLLLAATAIVLLVACANLAALLLAHLSGRRQEIAMKAALGATRGRIVRELLTESLLLALAGGAAATVLARWGIAAFVATLGKPAGAAWMEFSVDWRVIAFSFAVAVVTALLFGVAPAFAATRVDLRGVLQEGRSGPPRGSRLRAVLVAGQIAVSLMFVAAGAAVIGSSRSFEALDPGFDRTGLVALRVNLTGPAYDTPAQRVAYVERAEQALRAVPGVEAATATSHLPLGDRDIPQSFFLLDGWTSLRDGGFASLRSVSDSYLDVMKIPVRSGRGFTVAESRDGEPRAVMINETMARRYWPQGNAAGERLRLTTSNGGAGAWLTIVGVVGDVAQRGLPARPENQLYLPLPAARDFSIVVRGRAGIAADAREALATVDRGLPMTVRTIDDIHAWYEHDRRSQGQVLAALGAIALLLAALGVYAVMALLVSQQRHELAIRLALGSTGGALLRLVLARAARLAGAGIGAGALLALAATAFLSSIFFGVRAFDVTVTAVSALVLAAAALGASWWPARRAARVDPLEVLRS